MKRIVVKIVMLASICMSLVIIGGYLCTNCDGQYVYRMMNEMYSCEENIDIVFLGSSHIYRSCDTVLADSILNEKTFNAGSSSQGMNTSYYLLKEICKYNDVKEVYLDTYYGLAKMEENDASVFIVTDYMKASANKTELLWNSGGAETLLNGYLKFRRNNTNFHIIQNWRSRKSEISDYSSISYENEEYRGEGFVYSFEEADMKRLDFGSCSNYNFNKGTPVSDYYYTYLLQIIKFCKDNNVKLTLIDQPMPKQNTDMVIGYDNYVQFFRRIATENGIEYWNFNLYKGDLGLQMSDYKDTNHLNGKGAEKYTEIICKLIICERLKEIEVQKLFRENY